MWEPALHRGEAGSWNHGCDTARLPLLGVFCWAAYGLPILVLNPRRVEAPKGWPLRLYHNGVLAKSGGCKAPAPILGGAYGGGTYNSISEYASFPGRARAALYD